MSRATLRSWNPFINGYCDNISSYVNQTICISNPLGNHKVPENKDSASFSIPVAVPNNIAPDTNTKCGLFHNITAGDDCGTIGLKYSISLDDLIFLNPMIWENFGDLVDYPGYIHDDPTPVPEKVFVPLSPRAAGEIANCTRWFVTYFTYQSQRGHVRMSMEKIYRYDPSLKEDCSGYTLGTYYCHETIDDLLYGYEDDLESTPSQSASSTSRTSSDIAQPTNISTNSICGGTQGKSCLNSGFGDCCSSSGYCGSDSAYCGGGRMPEFGKCDTDSVQIRPDGTCDGERDILARDASLGVVALSTATAEHQRSIVERVARRTTEAVLQRLAQVHVRSDLFPNAPMYRVYLVFTSCHNSARIVTAPLASDGQQP
ncbi:hypothetical protein HG530_006418 [Fusarium avenaceum]|nr:hypothetical protein HG530_006418 [Fusarium avenaceum]